MDKTVYKSCVREAVYQAEESAARKSSCPLLLHSTVFTGCGKSGSLYHCSVCRSKTAMS